MAISIGERDEYVEGIPRQRKKIVWCRPFAAEARHGGSIPVSAIANNGLCERWLNPQRDAGGSVDCAEMVRRLLAFQSRCVRPPQSTAASPAPTATIDNTAGPGRLSCSNRVAAYTSITQ